MQKLDEYQEEIVQSVYDCLEMFHSHIHKQGKQITLQEYVDAMAEGQEKIYYISGESKDRLAKLPQVKLLEEKGYDVLLCTDEVDEFIPQTLMTYEEKSFCNAATEDLGLQSDEQKEQLKQKDIFNSILEHAEKDGKPVIIVGEKLGY